MKPSHSPEPWTFCIEEEGRSINGFLCELEEADIRRIVVCVNAMKGIPDPEFYRHKFEKLERGLYE